jgi:hypothetical protein
MLFNKNPLTTIALTLVLAVFTNNHALAQLTVNGSITPAQLVQNILLGPGITASNITYTGNVISRGSFNGSSSNVGFAAGVLLTNGDIANAVGPNNNSGASGPNGLPGDPDLDAIMSPTTSFDASIIEFDFVPLSDTVKFRYVFGSDEYMEFVSQFPGGINDGFGFFISGPGINGPFSNNSQNIAIIPGTSLPVTMFNLNLNNNSSFYFDNGDGNGTGTAPDGLTVQYDGFTVPLTAIAAVQCGQTYHIKIAIGDGSDDIIDSGVFLEAQSFSSPGVSIIPQFSYGGQNDTTLYEGCGDACILFVRGGSLAGADTINLVISGTATNGTDYYENSGGPGTQLPSQIIFPIGEDSVSYCITGVSDIPIEGMESIILTVPAHSVGSCVQPAVSSTIYLNEYTQMSISTSNDTTLCNTLGAITLMANVTGGVQPYSYVWTNGAAATATPTVNPIQNTMYKVTVNDACGGTPDPTPFVSDSITVSFISIPSITSSVSYGGLNDSTFYEGCGQVCIYFVRTINVANAITYDLNIAGTATTADYTPTLPSQLIFAAGQDSIFYCLQAVADGINDSNESIVLSVDTTGVCNLTASKTLHIAEAPALSIVMSPDTTLNCVTGPITLSVATSGGLPPYTYNWSNGGGNVSSQTVTPSGSTIYSVTVSDGCTGTPDPTPNQTGNSYVTVNIPPPLTVNAGDDVTACPDDVINLVATVGGGALPLIYAWTNTTGPDTAQSPATTSTSVLATSSTLFTITVTDNCGNTQSDQVMENVEINCLLNLPNVISPDGQGSTVNETFYIENLNRFPPSSLIIYNRYGTKLFESNNYANNWSGSKYSDGTYFYVLTIPASGQVMAKTKKSNKLGQSFNEAQVGTDKVFTGFFQIVRSK